MGIPKDYKDQAEITEVLRAKGFCGKLFPTMGTVCCKMQPCPDHPEELKVVYRDFTATLVVDPNDDNMYTVHVNYVRRMREFRDPVPIDLTCNEADDLYTLLGKLPRGKKAPDDVVRRDTIATDDLACAIVKNGGPYQIDDEHDCVHVSRKEFDKLRGIMQPPSVTVLCPSCRASHSRGFVDGVSVARCLNCGYTWDTKPPPRKCEVCGAPATHAEHWHLTHRLWCDKCVPMSGHYEFCHPHLGTPHDPCKKLLAELNAKAK